MTTGPDDTNVAKVSASFSLRTVVMVGLVAALGNWLLARTSDSGPDILHRLDELNTRVSRIEGALGVHKVAAAGAEGTGGTAAYSSD